MSEDDENADTASYIPKNYYNQVPLRSVKSSCSFNGNFGRGSVVIFNQNDFNEVCLKMRSKFIVHPHDNVI